jgi:hypothetical protein
VARPTPSTWAIFLRDDRRCRVIDLALDSAFSRSSPGSGSAGRPD